MASTIKLKNGSGAPLASALVQGEPAFDLTNKRLYTENASGTVIEVGTNPSSLTIGGTALTATAAELNTLDGITATVTELNYTDGVTSNIQTQLNTKAPIASPTFTGTVTAPAVNVNGTVTADGLTVDGAIVGQSATGYATATLKADTSNTGSGGTPELRFELGGTQKARLRVDTSDNVEIATGTGSGSTRFGVASNGDISFYEDTGTTAKFFWDASAESLGIGTSSPDVALHVVRDGNNSRFEASSGDAVVFIKRADSSGSVDYGTLAFEHSTGYAGAITARGTGSGNADLIFKSGVAGSLSEAMRINSSGNVGIGTSSPAKTLDVNGEMQADIYRYPNANVGGIFDISGSNGIEFYGSTNAGANKLVAYTGGTERMRIDSSGNLLVGTTSTSTSTAGHALLGGGADNGIARHVATSIEALQIGRNTTDGNIAVFYKDGTTVGSIGVASSYLTIGSPVGSGGHLLIGNNLVHPATSTGASKDASIDIGGSSNRFKDLYLSGGVYLGGTGAANHLDDYEEGTWTGTLTGGTTAPTVAVTATGTYTKVGRQVTVNVNFNNKDTTGATGTWKVTGLPFTCSGGALGSAYSGKTANATDDRNAFIASDNSIALLDGAGNSISWSIAGAGTYAHLTIVFQTA